MLCAAEMGQFLPQAPAAKTASFSFRTTVKDVQTGRLSRDILPSLQQA
jgi:hypothetical protein